MSKVACEVCDQATPKGIADSRWILVSQNGLDAWGCSRECVTRLLWPLREDIGPLQRFASSLISP